MAERAAEPSTAPAPANPKHPRTRQTFLAVAAVLSLVVAGVSGFSMYTIRHLEHDLAHSRLCVGATCPKNRDSIPSITNPFCTKVCTFLLLGSDTRAGLSKQEQAQFGSQTKGKGQRADTIIVARVDSIHHRTTVLSIPRDLRVDIPGFGVNKINTAFGDGRDVLVQTVEKLIHMQINHYVEINFVGFQSLVNALGGVPVCVPKPMIDPLAGLKLPHAGCYDLHGPQALAFVRARHIQGDIIPDFSRISRQQQFLRALINKALSVGAIFKVPRFVEAAKSNLRYDASLNLEDIQDLAHRLASLGQGNVQFRTLPATPVTINGEDFVQLVQPAASKLLSRIRQGSVLGQIGLESSLTPISPANITVHVYDASSGGKADAVANYLKHSGFVVNVQPATGNLSADTIYSGSGSDKAEQVVQSYLVNMTLGHEAGLVSGPTVVVVVGPDYRQRDIPSL
jgi:polyisoprenyl-teichoic acid--peptidoglycan teichoic acid transferase